MKALWEKIKKIKHFEIYIAVIIIVIIIAIYFSSLNTGGTKTQKSSGQTADISGNTYADNLERKLTNIISSIKNAGSVTVMVMTDGNGTNEIAYDYDEKTVTQTGSNGQSTTTTTINKRPLTGPGGMPIVVSTTTPQIIGIVIVASGAYDVSVKMAILMVTQTVIGDNNVNIQILTGK